MSLNYQIALTNVPFDKDYKNVIRFGTREEQEEYFQVSSLFSTAPDVNLNAGNLFETTLLYKYPDNTDITDMLNANYCIVKNKTQNASLKYLYFFIEDIVQDSAGQVKLRVKMDIFQTYYIDTEFSPCHISKAHLNRWIDNGDGTVSFDGTVTSKLFEREELKNVAQRLISRTKISVFNNMPNMTSTIENWLNENVIGWCYLYLDSSHGFNMKKSDGTTQADVRFLQTEIEDLNGGHIDTNLTAICFPILKNGKSIRVAFSYFGGSRDVSMTQSLIKRFMEMNNGAEFVYSMKMSSNPPFYFANSVSWTLSADENTLTIGGTWGLNSSLDYTMGEDFSNGNTHIKIIDRESDWACFYVERQAPSIKIPVSTSVKFTFPKSDIIGSNKDVKFNPKLLSSDYFSLKVGNCFSNSEYDMQKLNKENFNVLYTEPLSADITRNYIRYEGDNNDIFIKDTSKNYTGEVNSNDGSVILVTTAYQDMLANQKNFYQQNALNRGAKLGKDIFGGIASAVVSAATANPAGVVMGVKNAIYGGVDFAVNKAQENMTVDNMKYAPSNIENVQGNVYFQMMSSGLGLFVEEYDILDNEKNIVNDFMDMYGFTVNLIGNIKDYDNIRKYHNYIRANVEQTNGIPISEKVHEEFVSIFARGVRFWNVVEGVDLFKYDLENYEIALEE
jgi:hypothetical protein